MPYKIEKFHKCLSYFYLKFDSDSSTIDGVMLGKTILAGLFNRPVSWGWGWGWGRGGVGGGW